MARRSKKALFPDLKHSRYNVAAWTSQNDNVFLITREIERESKENEPDFSRLILAELDKKLKPIREFTIWEATNESLLLEDPRAMSKPDDTVTIGLSAVLRGGQGEYIPYPAVTKLNTRHWKDMLPAVTIIESFGPGKNTTPVEEDTYFFRPDGSETSHQLLVFSLKDMVPRKIQYLRFPMDLKWAEWKIGTAMPPIWLDENNALMIMHGITIRDGKFIYSLGRAILSKHNGKYDIKVDKKALITPEYFRDSQGNYLVDELHPELRKVVYCCGGILKPTNKEKLILFVNVGDMNTFLVEYKMEHLTKGLI